MRRPLELDMPRSSGPAPVPAADRTRTSLDEAAGSGKTCCLLPVCGRPRASNGTALRTPPGPAPRGLPGCPTPTAVGDSVKSSGSDDAGLAAMAHFTQNWPYLTFGWPGEVKFHPNARLCSVQAFARGFLRVGGGFGPFRGI